VLASNSRRYSPDTGLRTLGGRPDHAASRSGPESAGETFWRCGLKLPESAPGAAPRPIVRVCCPAEVAVRHLVVLVALSGCLDYKLNPEEQPVEEPIPDTDVEEPIPDTDETDEPDPVEECNGADDDGDGLVDEDFPDTDADGVADCLDEDCAVDPEANGSIGVDAACSEPKVVTDPWNLDVAWHWTGLAADPDVNDVLVTPLVGNLTDDDADGDIDLDDDPDVVFLAFDSNPYSYQAKIVVLDGLTGMEHWSLGPFADTGGLALGDVDADGVTDIVAFSEMLEPVVIAADGTELWRGPYGLVSTSFAQATVADVDMDGQPEVIAHNVVLDGATGTVEATIPTSFAYTSPSVGDIDLDGVQEIILANVCYDPVAKKTEWTSGLTGDRGSFTLIVDADGDPEGEVVLVAASRIEVRDADGTRIGSGSVAESQVGPPCAADFDGDGVVEVAVPHASTIGVYELDGTDVWSAPVDDSSGMAGCVAYDIDGDGAYEVVYADQTSLWILDGKTGAVQFSDTRHGSGTGFETPAIADIDGDGSADIVVANNDYWWPGIAGVNVYGQVDGTWRRSGRTWGLHDFAVTNLEEDGGVPASPVPWWQVYNLFRARPSTDDPAVDLQIAITDVCAAGCTDESEVEVAVQVGNAGGLASPDGVTVTLYRDDAGTLTALDSRVIGAVPPGETAPGLVFVVSKGDAGTHGFAARVDDDGDGNQRVLECDETDNQASWSDLPC
jgi:hypothetical protein